MYKKYIYLVLTLLCVAFFYKGIPLDVFHDYTTILTLLGGALSTVLLSATIFQFYLPKAKLKDDKKPDNLGCFFIIIVVVFFFGFSGFLIFNNANETTAELEKNGKYTIGEIVNGSSFETRRADFTSVIIRYKTTDGKVYQTNQDISAREFENYYRFQEIPIVYSSRYPTILKILKDDAEIAKYSKREIRDITLSDLERIVEMKTPVEINRYLNSINEKWGYSNTSSTFVFSNNIKKISIDFTPGKGLIYTLENADNDLFEKELINSDFKKIDSQKLKGIVYVKPGYLLNKQNPMVRFEGSGRNSLGIEQKTIIYLAKTNQ